MRRVLGLIALLSFPAYFDVAVLGTHIYEGQLDSLTLLGLVVSVAYFVAAIAWWFNPGGTHKSIKVFVITAQVVGLLGVVLVVLSCIGC